MKQTVAHKKLSTLHGLLLVAVLILLLVFLNYVVLGVLATYIGNKASSIAFWVFGCLIAWIVLQVYILKYNYKLGDDVLQITRSYGKRERFIENIYLRQLVFMGKPEEAQKRWPNARKVRALHLKGENLTIALVYKASDGHRIALIQANDALKAELALRMKEK